jgi:hypothetical protein
VVVLSGLGERAVVRDIASHDAAPAVRAVAVAYTIRTAERPHNHELYSFVRACLRDNTSEVRLAVLMEVQGGRVELDTVELRSATKDTDASVRRAAWLCLIARAARDRAAAAALAGVRGKVQVRDLDEVVRALDRLETLSFLSALKDHNKFAVVSYLTAVVPKQLELSWDELAFLFDCREPIVRSAVLERARGDAPLAALPWLVEGILDSSDDRYFWASGAWPHIERLLSPATVELIPPGERGRLGRFIERRRALALAELQCPEEEDEWNGFDRTFLEGEVANLSRLLAYLHADG